MQDHELVTAGMVFETLANSSRADLQYLSQTETVSGRAFYPTVAEIDK